MPFQTFLLEISMRYKKVGRGVSRKRRRTLFTYPISLPLDKTARVSKQKVHAKGGRKNPPFTLRMPSKNLIFWIYTVVLLRQSCYNHNRHSAVTTVVKGGVFTFRRTGVCPHISLLWHFFCYKRERCFWETPRLNYIEPCFYIVVKMFLGNCGIFRY